MISTPPPHVSLISCSPTLPALAFALSLLPLPPFPPPQLLSPQLRSSIPQIPPCSCCKCC